MVAPLSTNLSRRVRVVDQDVDEDDAASVGSPDLVRLSVPLTPEVTAELFGTPAAQVEEILLAALARAIARTIGTGVVTVNGLITLRPIRLCCATETELDATCLLAEVRRALVAPPDGRLPADVAFSHLGLPPGPSLGPAQVSDGPALGVLSYRSGEILRMQWWYDARRLHPATVDELATQFRRGLVGLTSELGG